MKNQLTYVQWLIFWLNALLSCSIFASEQNFSFVEPEFETLRNAQAIGNQPITAMAQDTRGLIWIGTQQGLFRYDGYRFHQFAHKASSPFSLAGNYVHSLYSARDGRLWVGTLSDGISVFDPASEGFEHFRHDEKIPTSLGAGGISAIVGDMHGGMWIATDNGLDHLPVGSQQFVHFKHNSAPHSLLDDKVRSLLFDKTGHLWVGGRSGLQRLSLNSKYFETIVLGKDVQSLLQAQDGKLWLGTLEHGAAWLMPSKGPAQSPANWLPLAQLSNPRILGIAQVRTDQIWLTTYGGGIIIVTASDGQVLQTLRHDTTLPNSLALDTLKPLLLDRAGWLWVGTWGGGLQRMDTNNTLLRLLRHSPKRPNGLSHPDAKCMLELLNGQLLIGSSGNGIDIFDKQRGLIGGHRIDLNKPGALPDAFVSTLAQTSDGSIWAGTQQNGVVRQLANSTIWTTVQGLPSQQVSKLLALRDGTLWAGTNRGVARLQANSLMPQSTGRFVALSDEQGAAMEFDVNALAEDRQGRVWIGTSNGLWLHEPKGKGLIRIPAEPNRPDGLISDDISSLLVDSRGSLWIATNKGLERLKSQENKVARFEHINALLGLTEQDLTGDLLEDQQGRIWREDVVIDPVKMRISRRDGIDLGIIWAGAHAKTREGLLLFGGADGVAIIDPAHFKEYNYAPPLVITELKINGKTVAPARLASHLTSHLTSHLASNLASNLASRSTQTESNTVASLNLEPTQRNFSFEFAALDYSEPKENRYQYRLQGYEKDWINTDADHRNAAYGNLWPGLYTLQVRGSNRRGDWSVHELAIPIRVLPAWWQTWWFAAAMLLCLSALFASLIQARTRYLRQRQLILKQQVEERTAELHQKQLELVHANADLVLSVETLRQLGDIGREITANLDANIVFQSLYMYVGSLLHAPTMSIYRINSATATLDAVFGQEDDHAMPIRNIALNSPTSNAARAAREQQVLLFNYDLNNHLSEIPGTRHMLTALFAPLIVDSKVLGVMSIQSDRENAYGERECLIFRTLSAYGAIALANAAAMDALHEAQGQLVQQEKMASLGNLVTGIAHEINTPLGNTLVAISGAEGAWKTLQNAVANGSLSKSVLDSSTAEGMEYTALALKTAGRAAELIALFKTISVNPGSDQITEIELVEYLQEVSSLVHSRLVQQNIQLDLVAPSAARIYVVPEALTETLNRIMTNALDHGFDNGRTGTLRLCAQFEPTEAGAEVIISVSDDGHGIAAEDLPKVFDPFFTTKSGLHGHVGLGLHVAYNHVTQRLKGKIHITSELDKGTTVSIRLKRMG